MMSVCALLDPSCSKNKECVAHMLCMNWLVLRIINQTLHVVV